MDKILSTTKFAEDEEVVYTVSDADYLLVQALRDLTRAIKQLVGKIK